MHLPLLLLLFLLLQPLLLPLAGPGGAAAAPPGPPPPPPGPGSGAVPGAPRGSSRAAGPVRVENRYLYWGAAPTAAERARLRAMHADQAARWFAWASGGRAEVAFADVFERLGAEELDAAGQCKYGSGGGKFQWNYPNTTALGAPAADDVDVVFFTVLAETCGNSCGTTAGRAGPTWTGTVVECTMIRPYIFGGTFTCDPEAAAYGTTLCDSVYVHEMVHALCLQYHQNAVQCPPGAASWRDCPAVEYGNKMDVLGGGGGWAGLSEGMAAKSRYDLNWLDHGADVELVTEAAARAVGKRTIMLAPLDGGRVAHPRPVVVTFDKASVGTLWLEYRAGSGFDAKLAGTANAGGLLAYHWGHILVDLAPAAGGTAGTAADYRRAALPAGQSWTDPATGLELRRLRTESARGGSLGALVFSLEFGAG